MIDPLIRIQMLGIFRVQQGERHITRFRYQKAASLLAYLAFYAGQTQSREQLIERFWPEFPPDAGRNNLSTILSSLRHQLEPPGTPTGSIIIADRLHVGLRPDVLAIDVAQFEVRWQTAQHEQEPAQQIQRLSDTLDLYAGPLLPGFYDEWIGVEGQRLADTFLQAARRLVRLLARAGERERALEIARRAVTVDPLREEAHRDLIQLYAAQGHPTAALEQYRQLEGILERELGVTPSAVTRRWITSFRARLSADTAPAERGDKTASASASSGAQKPQASEAAETPVPDASRRVLSARAVPLSGTVTFLTLTAPSTQEPAGDPDQTQRVWEGQQSLFNPLFARYGGQIVQSGSLSVRVAFAGASEALGCMLAARKALDLSTRAMSETTEKDSPVVNPCFVLHSGDVSPDSGTQPGPTEMRAQRLALAGHAGQLLCSDATSALLRRDLEPGIRLLDLGLYRLGAETEPEHVWQIMIADMPATSFPRLRAEVGMSNRLPLQRTRFFGREAEMERLSALLKPVPDTASPASISDVPETSNPSQRKQCPPLLRLVTLTGPGGIGKTRLALEAGARLEPRWEGAVWFLGMADIADASLIPTVLVTALGLPRSGVIEPLDQVVAALGTRPALLLMDNFEHLVEEGARWVDLLLQRVPTLTCLVTSRQRLEIAGEHEMALSPLPVPALPVRTRRHSPLSPAANSELLIEPSLLSSEGAFSAESFLVYDSVQLFVDRAQEVKPDFQITAGNATAIATLCLGLEGIPLAIELAAARAQVLTPSQMVKQLQDRFAFLVSRRRDMAARHRALLSTVEWSYRLLSDELKQIFARLSVFRGGWDLAAAEAICMDQDTVPLDALAQLRDCSLVLAAEEGETIRFGMLETLREYAQYRLQESGESHEVKTRHRNYFLTFAETVRPKLMGAEQAQGTVLLEREHENLRQALTFCLEEPEGGKAGLRLAAALQRFWWARGYLKEGRHYLAAALARHGEGQEYLSVRADALNGEGSLAAAQGDYASARALNEESLTIRRALRDRCDISKSLGNLGSVVMAQGDYTTARALHEESLVIERELGDKLRISVPLNNLGQLAYAQGDLEQARTLHEESLKLKREVADEQGIAASLNNLGNVIEDQGDYETARTLYEEALSLNRKLGTRGWQANNLGNLANVAVVLNDIAAAHRLYRECLTIFREIGNNRGIATALDALAFLAQQERQPMRVARLLGAATSLHEAIGSRRSPAGQETYQQRLTQTRSASAEVAFDAAFEEGRIMTLEQAIEYALSE